MKRRRMQLPVSDERFTELLTHVRAELKHQGFDAEADPEWEGPIVDGVWAACLMIGKLRQPTEANVRALAVSQAIRHAVQHKQRLAQLRLGDEAGARREAMPPVKTGLGDGFSIEDRDIINFVLAHGQGRAAKMLMMTPRQMRDLLLDIDLRVRANLVT